jgi:UDP-N-acetylmuramoylalanine--D-glutamate ligase
MKIAILGYGIEGKSAYEYFKKLDSENQVDVFDDNAVIVESPVIASEAKQSSNKQLTTGFRVKPGMTFRTGSRRLKPRDDTGEDVVKITTVEDFSKIDFSDYDLVVRSPSLRPDKIVAKNLTSATQIFFDNCPATIIGVTGTKGKGTTASFIYEILTSSLNNKVFLLGNIGKPALDALSRVRPNDVVVYELSSFQLWDLTKSPHIAVLTMLEPDHLDVHKDYQEYVDAKLNILRRLGSDDFAIINKNIDLGELNLSAKTLRFPDDSLRDLAKNHLVGEHNIDNAEAAILAARAFDPSIAKSQIEVGLNRFRGLPHRLKFVDEKSGVKYYDDSIATTPGSAIAAIKSFDAPTILILGGSDKGADYHDIGEAAKAAQVRQIFAIGANRDKVKNQVGEKFNGQITLLDDQAMSQIVKKAAAAAQSGDVVILSPAAASFDMFKNYQDRGQQFIDAVNTL